MKSRCARVMANLSLLLMGFLVAGAVFEVGVRAFTNMGDEFKVPDSDTYIKYAAGMKGVFVSPSDPAIRVPTSINTFGYRGPEWNLENRQILFVGDSYTAAFQVPYEDCFVAQSEIRLSAYDSSISCLNLGLSGSGTGLQLIHFEQAIPTLRPDAAVLQVSVVNDFFDNSKELNWKRYYPYWQLEDGQLKLLEPETDIPGYMSLARYSRGLGFLFQQYRHLLRKTASASPPTMEHGLYSPKASPEWNRAFDLTLKLIERFIQTARKEGIHPIVLIVPSTYQLCSENFAEDGAPLNRPQEAIKELVRDTATCIDLLPLLKQDSRTFDRCDWSYLPEDRHFNVQGHSFVAEVVSKSLAKVLRLEQDVSHPVPPLGFSN